MVQAVLDYSKQWPRLLSSLGIGLFFWSGLDSVLEIRNAGQVLADSFQFGRESVKKDEIASLLSLVVFSYVSGVIFVALGLTIQRIALPIDMSLRREVKVYEFGNPLIIQRYQRAVFQNEILVGVAVALFIMSAILVFIPERNGNSTESDWSTFLVGSIGASIFFVALVWSSISAFREIDEVLSDFEKRPLEP